MSRKRANGEGGLFQLRTGTKKGWWRGVVEFPRKPDGKRDRRTVTRKSKTAAAIALRKLQNKRDSGTPEAPTEILLSEWLRTREELFATQDRSPEWLEIRSSVVERHLIPHLDGVLLSKMSPAHVEGLLSTWAAASVGMRTREIAFQILRSAVEVARSRGIVPCDPFRDTARPKSRRKNIDPFTANEMRQVLWTAEDDRHEHLWTVAFLTGMRIGELLALSPRCLDLEAGTLRVERTARYREKKALFRIPKTERSRRTIDLPERAITAFHEQRKWVLAEGLAGSDLVFPSLKGTLIDLAGLRSKVWHPLLIRAGVAAKPIHQIRHTYATLQLLAGVPVPVVSAVLGHASPSITLDIYSHFVPTHQSLAREAMNRLFSAGG